jgi:secondary thiamine-phosphate synthase enzyme
MLESHSFSVKTGGLCDIIDITGHVARIISGSKMKSGLVNIFVAGSTASISTMEFEPNLVKDMKEALEKIAPENKTYHHKETWHDDNGFSHVRATLMKPEITVPFENKKLVLGMWQQIILLDFDERPRNREIRVTVLGE